MLRIPVLDKIIVHLYMYRKYADRYEYPVEMTQPGIAQAVGISVTHIPRNIKRLMEEGFVSMKKGHVSGKKKRVTVYFLTPQGLRRAKELIENLEKYEVKVGEKFMTLGEIRKLTGLSYLDILRKLKNGEIENEIYQGERIIFQEVIPDEDKFVGRREELERLASWFQEGHFAAIVGPRGMGKTSLIHQFLKRTKPPYGVIWLDVFHERTWESVKEVFRSIYGMDDVLSILRREKLILIFDGYFKVDDSFVSALSSLVREELERSKIIVSMLSETPYYNRFYTHEDVDEGRVLEIKLAPLSYEEAKLLFPDVREDAFRRIYQITKGHPRILSLLRRGVLENEKNIALSREQIHLLNYLASLKK